MYSLNCGAKSDELVTPHIAPAVSIAVSTPEDKIDWSKKAVLKDSTGAREGLGALFNKK